MSWTGGFSGSENPLPGVEPGNFRTLKGFYETWDSEEKLARYLGYKSRKEFRRFIISPWIITAYLGVFDGRGSEEINTKDVLRYIRDNEMVSDENPMIVFTSRNTRATRTRRMALAIQQLEKSLKKPLSELEFATGDAQRALMDQFKRVTKKKLPFVYMGDFVRKNFGPHDGLGEGSLEKFNRCFNAIMFLHVLVKTSGWDNIYGSKTSRWDEDIKMPDEYLPCWQREEEDFGMLDLDAMFDFIPSTINPAETPRQAGVSREVTIIWRYAAKTPWAKELWERLQENDLHHDLIYSAPVVVQASTNRDEFLNLIRERFKMDGVGAEIRTLQMMQPERNNVLEQGWSTIEQVLWREDRPGVAFEMTLRKKAGD